MWSSEVESEAKRSQKQKRTVSNATCLFQQTQVFEYLEIAKTVLRRKQHIHTLKEWRKLKKDKNWKKREEQMRKSEGRHVELKYGGNGGKWQLSETVRDLIMKFQWITVSPTDTHKDWKKFHAFQIKNQNPKRKKETFFIVLSLSLQGFQSFAVTIGLLWNTMKYSLIHS